MVRSLYQHLSELDTKRVEQMFLEMRQQAQAIIDFCQPKSVVKETRKAFMRYIGQGHEIEIELPDQLQTNEDCEILKQRFDREYQRQYARTIPDMDIEILSWSLNLYEANEFKKLILDSNLQPSGISDSSSEFRKIYDFSKNTFQSARVFQRSELNSGQILEGTLLIQETDTTIVVPEGFSVSPLAGGHLMLEQK